MRLPVEPSEGNYYEAGLTKVFYGKTKLDVNYFRRLWPTMRTTIRSRTRLSASRSPSQKSVIYGAEAKVEVPDWHRFSGFLSYSYTGWQCLVSGDGRHCFWATTLPDIPTQRPFPRFAGSAQYRARAASLPGASAFLARRLEFNTTPGLPISSSTEQIPIRR